MTKTHCRHCCFTLLIITTLFACSSNQEEGSHQNQVKAVKNFDIQGHRGARGLYPENSIMGFVMAANMGIKTLELDVVITKDKKVIVSHEPFMSHSICETIEGEEIPEDRDMEHNIYEMTYDEVRKYDCGSRENPRFPDQLKVITYKPLLKYAVEVVETFTVAHHMEPVWYNIETKCLPEGDNLFHPEPEEFCALLYDELTKLKILDRVIIQSFDVRTLQVFRKSHPKLPLALLVENSDGYDANIESLGFVPQIYSPNYKLVDEALVEKCHADGVRLIPWTVNEEAEMERMAELGADGLITDYPDIALTLLR